MKCENIGQNSDKTETLMAEQNFTETSNGETLNVNRHFKGYEKSEQLELYRKGIAQTI